MITPINPITRRTALAMGLAGATAMLRTPTWAAGVGGAAPGNVKPVVPALSPFGLNLYKQLGGPQVNAFFSSLSVAEALGMLTAGAKGETANELAAALGIDQGGLPEVMATLNTLLAPAADRPYQLAVANAIWAERTFALRAPYTQLLKDKYTAAGFNCDFKGQGEAERIRINGWVAEQTKDRIKDLLPRGSVNGDSRMVLTNAIYFKANWLNQFSKDATRDGDFTLFSGQKAKAKLMSNKVKGCGFLQDNSAIAVNLPYKGESASMLAILPRQTGAAALADLEKSLTPQRLADITGTLRKVEVQVTLPRFKIETQYDLIPALTALGIHRAFTPGQADFGGVTDSAEARQLYVSGAFHKAFVEVDEVGTEAAAATGLVMSATAVMLDPPTFRADRPFLFAIRDRKSGEAMFMGRVMDPT